MQIKSLDLTDPASYAASLEWVRNNVILRKTAEGSVLRLDIAVIGASATVFMNPVNHYILAFKGADAVYVLQDESSSGFKSSLESAFGEKKEKTAVIQLGLGAHHGYRGLETIGKVNQAFHKLTFQEVEALGQYSRKSESYNHLRRPLSLLVYMIAEGARFSMVQNEMIGIYYGRTVEASPAIQSYHDAQALQKMAHNLFSQERVAIAVDKLEKRSAELVEILDWYEKRVPSLSRKQLTAELLIGRDPLKLPPGRGYTERFGSMCGSLKLTKADQVADLIQRCQNSPALRAAKGGVISPPVAG